MDKADPQKDTLCPTTVGQGSVFPQTLFMG